MPSAVKLPVSSDTNPAPPQPQLRPVPAPKMIQETPGEKLDKTEGFENFSIDEQLKLHSAVRAGIGPLPVLLVISVLIYVSKDIHNAWFWPQGGLIIAVSYAMQMILYKVLDTKTPQGMLKNYWLVYARLLLNCFCWGSSTASIILATGVHSTQ